MKKAISLLLLAALLCGAISCSDSGNGGNDDVTTDGTTTSADTTVAEAETTADNTPKLGLPEDLKYDGYTFTFYGRGDMENKFIADEEWAGDTMNDAVWARQQKVSDLLDVNFEYLYCSDTYANDAKDIILAGDDTYDVILPHARFAFQYAMSDLALNWLTDLKYVDLDAEWWPKDCSDSFQIGNMLCAMTGDIDYSNFGAAKCFYFNRATFDKYSWEYPYQLVRDGKWTFDKMIEYATASTEDLNGDSKYEFGTDHFGFATTWWGTPVNILTTAGVRMCEKDSDNKLEITLNSERTVDVFEHFFSAMNQDGLYILKQDDTTPISDAFRDSKLTFAEVDIKSSENYREMNDDFGIIPCPKYDESVEGYPSLVDASCNLFVVPVSVSDADRVSAVLEALAYYGWKDVLPAYYDVALSVKFARDDDSVKMLDIIRDNRSFDIGYYCGPLPMTISSTGWNLCKTEDHNFASFYAANIDAAQAVVDEINEQFTK